uniref:Phosphoprotein n=1 Tax=Cytorhabdovirus sp. TaxID=2714181 RepID=A0A6M3GWD0_9RHAB|nr:phosphoprotein [Cytorhabdovirus sp.]
MSSGNLTPFRAIPDTDPFPVRDIRELLRDEKIFEDEEETMSVRSDSGLVRTRRVQAVEQKIKDDMDLQLAYKKGRNPFMDKGEPSTRREMDTKKAQPPATKPSSSIKQKIKRPAGEGKSDLRSETSPRDMEDTSPKYENVQSMLKDLTRVCKGEGIIPVNEYQDLLAREMSTADGYLTERDLRMFVIGVRAEKVYSSQQLLKDTISSLSQVVAKLTKTQKALDDSRNQLVSSFETHQNKIVEVVKETVKEKFEEFIDQVDEVNKDEREDAKGKAKIVEEEPEESYGEVLDQVIKKKESGASVYLSDITLPPEGLEELDLSELKRPADYLEFGPVAVAELGLPEEVLDDDRKLNALLHGPTFAQKMVLFNGMANDDLKDLICAKMMEYYKSH